jgi:large subunit ribosomal protein L24
MRKFKIKVGDYVKVIAGSSKGSEGKVINVIKKREKIIIEGLNMVKKHLKPNSKNPQGGIEEKESPIHISNVSLIDNNSTKENIKKEKKSKTIKS